MTESQSRVLSGRVAPSVAEAFLQSVERPWRKGDCLAAAALLWASLPYKVRSDVLVASVQPQSDLLMELLTSLGLDAARVVKEAEARYKVQRRRASPGSTAAG